MPIGSWSRSAGRTFAYVSTHFSSARSASGFSLDLATAPCTIRPSGPTNTRISTVPSVGMTTPSDRASRAQSEASARRSSTSASSSGGRTGNERAVSVDGTNGIGRSFATRRSIGGFVGLLCSSRGGRSVAADTARCFIETSTSVSDGGAGDPEIISPGCETHQRSTLLAAIAPSSARTRRRRRRHPAK